MGQSDTNNRKHTQKKQPPIKKGKEKKFDKSIKEIFVVKLDEKIIENGNHLC